MKGFFITFEGTEGSGKTTAIEKIEQYYINKGFNVIRTREPGGSKIAEQIRNVIEQSHQRTLLLLIHNYICASQVGLIIPSSALLELFWSMPILRVWSRRFIL